jgi:AcrR family transcriptional regulator
MAAATSGSAKRPAARPDATRTAIVAAARRLLAEQGFRHLSVEAVAAIAGVTRVTVYNQLGSKLGLLEAIFADLAQQGQMGWLGTLDRLAPRPALTAAIQHTTRFWASERALLRQLLALATIDPQAARIIQTREQWRQAAIGGVVDRLATAGLLAPAISPAEATAAITAVSSFAAYDQLGELAEDPATAARLIDRLADGLLHPGARG